MNVTIASATSIMMIKAKFAVLFAILIASLFFFTEYLTLYLSDSLINL